MQIAILGSGNVGKALASSLTGAGHRVTLTASTPDHARAAASQTGAQAADSNTQAIADAEVVVLAVQYPTVDAVLADAGDALDGKVLIDTTNRVDPANPGSVLDGTPAAEQLQARIPGGQGGQGVKHRLRLPPGRPGHRRGRPGRVPGRRRRPGQADRQRAGRLDRVPPIDVGPLVMARALEGLALLNIMLQIRNNWPWQAGFKLVGPTS